MHLLNSRYVNVSATHGSMSCQHLRGKSLNKGTQTAFVNCPIWFHGLMAISKKRSASVCVPSTSDIGEIKQGTWVQEKGWALFEVNH